MYQRIVVGTDGSETATRAVVAAAEIARAHAARLCVTSAYAPRLTADQRDHWNDTPEKARWRLSAGAMAEEVVQSAIGHARAVAGKALDVVGRSEPGAPVDVLLHLVDELDADMVIVGNRGMTGLGRVRGCVARSLSRQAPCDVLIVDTVGAEKAYRTKFLRSARMPAT